MFIWSYYTMAVLYIVAGIFHFIKPETYKRIIPGYLPYPGTLVLLSGIAEILLGILLFFPNTSRIALYGIIIMLILFLPVHIHMVRDPHFEKYFPKWLLILRIPIQFILITWAYIYI
ncbi:DoxX family protein [Robertkochia solimangrovi]|uniref:DoxX family protein n=1 Tax=Robertkochia solimangrovi TaxID=2213046 RepID=UPI00117D6E71|nr:MauE/DoxX family redox-associated membrane protein [Robertkochia solimangrovi]TRZ41788.1 hypothetical protein DMZ48_15695 [Robertkochia solimangrovi]